MSTNLFGEVEVEEEIIPESKKLSFFDILNDINGFQKDLRSNDGFTSAYEPFMINRYMSLYPDTIEVANTVNTTLSILDKEIQYHFYLIMIKGRTKRFEKYEKSSISDNAKLISKYYNISINRAEEIVDLHTDDDISFMKEYFETGGTSRKI